MTHSKSGTEENTGHVLSTHSGELSLHLIDSIAEVIGSLLFRRSDTGKALLPGALDLDIGNIIKVSLSSLSQSKIEFHSLTVINSSREYLTSKLITDKMTIHSKIMFINNNQQ